MTSSPAQPVRPGRRNPSLLPREHGVYAEVLFPIVTALVIGPASLAGICFAIAIIAAFLVHEPVLVLLGRRGAWVKTGLGPQARRHVIVLALIVAVCGVVGLWHASTAVRISFLLLVPVAVPLAFLVAGKQEKTLAGECLIAFILSLASVPITMAGGASMHAAGAAALVWTVVFVTSTVTVHAILARTKRHTHVPAIIVMALSLAVVLLSAWGNVSGGPMWLVALIPAPLVAFGVLAARLPVKRLRTLGWLLVLGNLLTAALLVWTLA
jgi:hypothetical protein